jgi:hypothetical protein
LHLVAFANEGKLQGKVTMYILQEMCPVLHGKIDKIRGKRNVETGVETVVCKKWSNTHRRI